MRQLVDLFARVPALERHAAAVYLVRGFARGDLEPTSDIDLVVVIGDDERAILDELRGLARDRVSMPKVATADAWRAFEALYPAEFAYPTRTDARLLVGAPVVTADWAGADLLDDVRDSMVRHLARALFAITRLAEPRHTAEARVRLRRAALRFLRAALWAASDIYVGASDEVRAASARRFGGWTTELFADRLAPAAAAERLCALHRELDPRLAACAPVPPATFLDWHGSWLEPRYRPRALVPDDREVARLRAEGYQVAVMPPTLAALVLARVIPHAGVAVGAPIAHDDLVREARRTLAHHAFNWRNMWLDWPDAQGRIDARRIGYRIAEVLDAILVLETGTTTAEPELVPARFRAAFPGSPLLAFVDAFAADPGVWIEQFPAFARAVRA